MAAALPDSVPAVVERLREIEQSGPRSDGVACFAGLYRRVTEGVGAELAQRTFEDARFLERLDVGFAGLFFAALEAYEQDATDVPSAWAPLFAQRSRRGIAPLQFALAGMNAHINRDLPVALVATCQELGLDLLAAAPEHADFERVDVLLAQVERRIKDLYLTGWLRALDRLLHRIHRIDDVVAMWDVSRARDAAWTNGQTLWGLRGLPELGAEFLEALDRMVGFAGRGLLVPADSWIQKLGRLVTG
ncbi:MAG TPA: DUF5995 family protein [Gaiellaceae bacterium]|nr:DUF5995 family protein [Gaiellaceae bacterium]